MLYKSFIKIINTFIKLFILVYHMILFMIRGFNLFIQAHKLIYKIYF